MTPTNDQIREVIGGDIPDKTIERLRAVCGLSSTPCSPKIIQLLIAPNDSTWQGILLGLGDDGVTYQVGTGTKWEPMIPPINSGENVES